VRADDSQAENMILVFRVAVLLSYPWSCGIINYGLWLYRTLWEHRRRAIPEYFDLYWHFYWLDGCIL